MPIRLSLFLAMALACAFVVSTQAQANKVVSGAYSLKSAKVSPRDRETRILLEGECDGLEYLRIEAVNWKKNERQKRHALRDGVETLIIVREGKIKATTNERTSTLGPSSVILLMPGDRLFLNRIDDLPISYFTMSYRSQRHSSVGATATSSGTLMINGDSVQTKPTARGATRSYFDRPTQMCYRFEMHVTRLDKKGESHSPHKHTETEIILIVSGETQMTIDGKEFRALPGDFYLMTSDSFHGIQNLSDTACEYFAFKWK